jgi:hypothetical protein
VKGSPIATSAQPDAPFPIDQGTSWTYDPARPLPPWLHSISLGPDADLVIMEGRMVPVPRPAEGD